LKLSLHELYLIKIILIRGATKIALAVGRIVHIKENDYSNLFRMEWVYEWVPLFGVFKNNMTQHGNVNINTKFVQKLFD